MKLEKHINIDFKRFSPEELFRFHQGDKNSWDLIITCYDNGEKLTLTGVNPHFNATLAGVLVEENNTSAISISSGKIKIAVTENMAQAGGELQIEVMLAQSTQNLYTQTIRGYVEPSCLNETTVVTPSGNTWNEALQLEASARALGDQNLGTAIQSEASARATADSGKVNISFNNATASGIGRYVLPVVVNIGNSDKSDQETISTSQDMHYHEKCFYVNATNGKVWICTRIDSSSGNPPYTVYWRSATVDTSNLMTVLDGFASSDTVVSGKFRLEKRGLSNADPKVYLGWMYNSNGKIRILTEADITSVINPTNIQTSRPFGTFGTSYTRVPIWFKEDGTAGEIALLENISNLHITNEVTPEELSAVKPGDFCISALYGTNQKGLWILLDNREDVNYWERIITTNQIISEYTPGSGGDTIVYSVLAVNQALSKRFERHIKNVLPPKGAVHESYNVGDDYLYINGNNRRYFTCVKKTTDTSTWENTYEWIEHSISNY